QPAKPAMSIVTISWGSLSSGLELAQKVAGRLGCRCLGREELTEAAAKYGIPEIKLSELFEKKPTFWERLTESRQRYLLIVRAAMFELAQSGPMVYHGQGGQTLLKDISHVLKVWAIASLESRVKAAMHQGQPTREAALHHIRQIDEERLRRTRELFNVDWRDASLYDLVVNLQHMSMDAAVDAIVYLAEAPYYQPTAASQRALDDMALAARVRVALAIQEPAILDIDVRADGGVVWLSGAVEGFDDSDAEEVVAVARRVPGVREVHSELKLKPVLPYLAP
ncbi:MAG: cytidylate kinase family protein, partial [Chloroflexota bacterium]|nr:cytidylate kinase family protein [Chloroflexota bacterium]